MAAINGFTVVPNGDSALANFKIPGSPARLKLRREVASLLVGFARDFGTTTRAGVRWYQGMRGIDVTGIVDQKAWRHMRIKATF